MKYSQIEKLAEQIRAADIAYYNTGVAILEDATYDALKDQLKALDPSHELLRVVGAATSDTILSKAAHSIPMGSQNKAMDEVEFLAWANTLGGNPVLHASLKMDGGSVSLEYRNGSLVRAITRGDGLVGEDITANALRFKNVPKDGVRIPSTNDLFTGFVRAEIMLLAEEWKEADPDLLTNPRNLGNGISRRKNGEQSELLTVYAFRAHLADGAEICSTESEMSNYLEKMGFNVAPWNSGRIDEVWKFFSETHAKRPSLPFWIDGVVVKVDDIPAQKAFGERDQRPKGQIAIKFPARGVKTVLREVELTVGHTGAIIPTGKFDPVVIDGTTVTSALLCNWEIIRALDIAVGDTIEVYKAGDIIPKVAQVLHRPDDRQSIPEPTVCPVCGGLVGRKKSVHGEDSVNLYCLNDDCDAKLSGKIQRWIKSLNILGIGDEILLTLIDRGILNSPADLYTLHEFRAELENLGVGEKGIRLGERRADRILDEIEKKRELTLSEFLGSLGIDGLGKRRVQLIQEAVPGVLDNLEDWLAGTLENVADKAGVPNMGRSLSEAVIAKTDLIQAFLNNGVTLKATEKKVVATDAKSFCFTGASSKPRKELVAMAEAAGHTVKSGVGVGLDYLVLADPDSNSSKAVKARKLGTQCISEEDFYALAKMP
jgi:DNA ligase (NAD+)